MKSYGYGLATKNTQKNSPRAVARPHSEGRLYGPATGETEARGRVAIVAFPPGGPPFCLSGSGQRADRGASSNGRTPTNGSRTAVCVPAGVGDAGSSPAALPTFNPRTRLSRSAVFHKLRSSWHLENQPLARLVHAVDLESCGHHSRLGATGLRTGHGLAAQPSRRAGGRRLLGGNRGTERIWTQA